MNLVVRGFPPIRQKKANGWGTVLVQGQTIRDIIAERRRKARIMRRKKPDIDRIFHALGDPTRRAMMERLSRGPMSVSRLAEPFEMTLAAVVQHMQVLEECGLVETEKVGRVRSCCIAPTGLDAMEQWIRDRRSVWERQLDRLGDLLGAEDGNR